MAEKSRIPSTAEAWESGALGEARSHAKRVEDALAQQIDEALGMQPISIRLPRTTIETYKMLATLHKVGYQPLMRDAICRWAESELKQVLIGAVETQRLQATTVRSKKRTDPDPEPMKKAA
jgi:hypothetical protein